MIESMDTAQSSSKNIKIRRYYTVSLSDVVIPGGEPYKCWRCGYRVTTVYNEPKTQVEIKITPEDSYGQKLTEHLCRSCDIIFIFV